MVDLFSFFLFILPGLYFSILIYHFFLISVPQDFTPAFSGTSVARSLIFCLVFCRLLFVLLHFSLGYCIAGLSSIYGI